MRSPLFSRCKESLTFCIPQAKTYLTKKYGEAFEIIASSSACWGMPSERFWARPLSKQPEYKPGQYRTGNGSGDGVVDDKAFAVFGYATDTQCVFSDAYYSVLIRETYEKLLHKLAAKYYSRYKLRLILNTESPNPDGLVKNTPITEIHTYIQPGGPLFSARITVWVPYSQATSGLYALAGELAEMKLIAWLKEYILPDEVFERFDALFDPFNVGVSSEADASHFHNSEAWRNLVVGEPAACFIGRSYTVKTHANRFLDAAPVFKTLVPPEKLESDVCAGLLTDWQLERLCALVYLDGLLIHRDEGTLGEITAFMLACGLEDCIVGGRLPCEMTEQEWRRVLKDIYNDARLSALVIIKTENITNADAHLSTDIPDMPSLSEKQAAPGHRAVAFMDSYGNAYAVFRGTGSDDEWYDNGLGMMLADTVHQQAALRFVESLRLDSRVKYLVTAGHSKGGNKAQYALMVSYEGCVDYGFSLDGQGFSPAFHEKYHRNIEARKNRIHLAAERRDFVNGLGLYLTENTRFYIGKRGDTAEGFPHGMPLPYFHCPDALRDMANLIGQESIMKPIPELFNQWIAFLLTEERYRDSREDTVVDLVALMMKNKRASTEDIAEALVNIIIVFMDLVCSSQAFRERVEALFFHETDVLLATFAYMRHKTEGKTGEGQSTAECLARRVITEPSVRRDFIGAFKHLVLLIKKILTSPGTEKPLLDYTFSFIETVLFKLTEGLTHRALGMVTAGWRILSGRVRMRCMACDTSETEIDCGILLASLEDWKQETPMRLSL